MVDKNNLQEANRHYMTTRKRAAANSALATNGRSGAREA